MLFAARFVSLLVLGFGALPPQQCHHLKLQADVRKITQELGFGDFTWHWLRRGFATDLLRSGTPLAELITAGGWKSAAFVRYLLREDIDEFATADRVFADSDSN